MRGLLVYFPYFYGRQVELLALRDVATDLAGWGNITPIIEPVMSDPRDLGTCLQRLDDVHAPLYVIANPNQGQLRSGTSEAWQQRIGPFIADPNPVYPAYQVTTEADAAGCDAFFRNYPGRRVAIVLRQPRMAARALAAQLADRDAIVFVHTSANPRAYLRELPAGKCVEVAAAFNEQERNADYSGSEWFTSSHLEFRNEGRPGFSDFGPLPTTFSLSGGQAGAVAIHLAYKADGGDLWMQHFVSDTTDRDEGDVVSKIAEAAAKLAAEVEGDPGKFVRSSGLRAYLESRVLNLSGNKRQQLIHHLTTVAALLGEMGSIPMDLD